MGPDLLDPLEAHIRNELEAIRDRLEGDLKPRFDDALRLYIEWSTLAMLHPDSAGRYAMNAQHALASMTHIRAESGLTVAQEIQNATLTAIRIGLTALGSL